MQPRKKFTCMQKIYIMALLTAHRLPSGLGEQVPELDMVVAACLQHRVVAACLLAGVRWELPTGNRQDTG